MGDLPRLRFAAARSVSALRHDGDRLHPGGVAPGRAAGARATLICPECDEPFEAEYLRRCHGCGHEFPDGFDDRRVWHERLTWRILLAVLGLAAVLGAMIAYLAMAG